MSPDTWDSCILTHKPKLFTHSLAVYLSQFNPRLALQRLGLYGNYFSISGKWLKRYQPADIIRWRPTPRLLLCLSTIVFPFPSHLLSRSFAFPPHSSPSRLLFTNSVPPIHVFLSCPLIFLPAPSPITIYTQGGGIPCCSSSADPIGRLPVGG